MNDEGKQVVAVEGEPGADIRSRMVGRTRDVRRICEMFAADAGRVLHVTGEPGIGKTTLLDAVAETMREAGTRVLRADGVASEEDFAYAGLHQILSPVLHRAAELPPGYRSALNVALGRGSGSEPDRLTVVNGVLALLRLASGEEPLLLVVDDLHLLDPAGAVVTGFVARRLAGTRIGFLAASRTGVPGGFEGRTPTELKLDPLDDDSAHLLLGARYPRLAGRVRARVVAEARGNPLALLEFPEQLTASQRSAQEGLPAVLPLGERTRSLYVSRVTALPPAERRLLLLAALDVTGGRAVLQIAVHATDPEPVPTSRASAGLAAAERDGLIRIDPAARQVVFTHPLIRSTVVDASTFDDRRAAHLALADAAAGHSEVRAWHVAEAAFVPDEAAAAALQKAAYPVLRRGDAVGAVATLVRAGEPSPEPGARGRRLAEVAAVSAETIGDVAKAPDLLRRARDAMDAPETHPGTSGALYAASQRPTSSSTARPTSTPSIGC